MILRGKTLNKKLIRYKLWKPTINKNRLLKSFYSNTYLNYKNRLSFLIVNKNFNKNNLFYLSQNKLQCFLHYSYSVPNKKLNVSRFFLSKGSESLMFGGSQK